MAKNKDLQIAKKIKKELKEKLGDNLVSVIFYGSRAKGLAKKESDLDLFLLMKKKPKYKSKKNEIIIDIAYRYLDKNNLFVSPVVYGLKKYKKYKNLSYLREVNKGIRLWRNQK